MAAAAICGRSRESRRQANEIKRDEPITVVIGNPPYKEKAKGRGGWVEDGARTRQSRRRSTPGCRRATGASAPTPSTSKPLRLLLALGDVEGLRPDRRRDGPDDDEAGIVCFITVAGFLNGPGFQRMRDDLRRTADEIWVIDCSPEGHQPEVPTRIFQGVQQPVCIVLAARRLGEPSERAGARALPRAAGGPARGEVRGAQGAVARRAGLDRLPDRLARPVPARCDRGLGRVPGTQRPVRL